MEECIDVGSTCVGLSLGCVRDGAQDSFSDGFAFSFVGALWGKQSLGVAKRAR